KAAALDRVVARILECVGEREDALALIVDDDADTRGILTDALAAAGCRAGSARSGVEMLEELARERPDVIVVDPLNAGADGIGSIARMRIDPALTEIPVVLMLPFEMTPVDMERLAASVEAVARVRRGRVHATAELLRNAAGLPMHHTDDAAPRTDERRKGSG